MSELADYVPELFEPFGPVTLRKMFGGYGVYREGLMFALVADDMLYLKADAENAGDFDELGLGPFQYLRNGKPAKISYYRAPEALFEDRELASVWAAKSYECALRARSRKMKSKRVTANRSGGFTV